MTDQISQFSNSNKPIHFIGIAGSGMAPLALWFKQHGARVQGSDSGHSPLISLLKEHQIKVFDGHADENLSDVDTIVYSSAIKPDNPELLAAREDSRFSVFHRSDLLRDLIDHYYSITVTGTHGKTTVSALLTYVLNAVKYPTHGIVGGLCKNTVSPCWYVHKARWLVAEADESDGSFLKYRPRASVITNIAPDHLSYFKSFQNIIEHFRKHWQSMASNPDSFVVVGWDQKICRDLWHDFDMNKLSFGTSLGADVRLINFDACRDYSYFEAVVDKEWVKGRLPLLGRHNVVNALAVLAVVKLLGLSVKQAAEAMETFQGIQRRLDCVWKDQDRQVYLFDDYAHNPDKIKASLTALSEAFQGHAIVVHFEPHRMSRIRSQWEDFAQAFLKADGVYVYPVYSAGEIDITDDIRQDLAHAVSQESQVECHIHNGELSDLRKVLHRYGQKTVHVILSAGSLGYQKHQFAEILKEHHGDA